MDRDWAQRLSGGDTIKMEIEDIDEQGDGLTRIRLGYGRVRLRQGSGRPGDRRDHTGEGDRYVRRRNGGTVLGVCEEQVIVGEQDDYTQRDEANSELQQLLRCPFRHNKCQTD